MPDTTFNAYKEIQESTALNNANYVLNNHNLIAVDNNAEIVDLQKYFNKKRNFEGTFTTPYLNQFFKFVERTADDYNNHPSEEDMKTSCFINPNDMNASVIFDFGSFETPLQQRVKAVVALEKTVIFQELNNKLNVELTQKQLSEFLEDFSSDIHATDIEGNVLDIGIAITAIRTMKIESNASVTQNAEDYKESSSAYKDIEAKFYHKTPKFIIFTIASHTGLSKREFICRISVKTGDDKIKLSLRCPKFNEVMEAINLEFQAKIEANDTLDSKNIYIGNWKI